MFQTPYFIKYHTDEFNQFLSFVVKICREKDVRSLQINKEVNLLHSKNQEIEKAWKIFHGSDLTVEIEKTDHRRDNAIICLDAISKGYTYHFEESLKNAGLTISKIIDKYGSSLHRLNYLAETSVIKNLVNDLKADEPNKSVQSLSLDNIVNELDKANKLFEDLYLERNKEMSAEKSQTITELKEEAVPLYRNLVNVIQAHILISSEKQPYIEIRDQINQLIEKQNNIVAQRQSSVKAEPDNA